MSFGSELLEMSENSAFEIYSAKVGNGRSIQILLTRLKQGLYFLDGLDHFGLGSFFAFSCNKGIFLPQTQSIYCQIV